MRIFNFRYLLFGAAMLAVWLLGRSRMVQPELDAAWTPITVSSEGSATPEVSGLIAQCKQNGACTDLLDPITEVAEQALPQAVVSQQAMLASEPDLVEESSFDVEPGAIDESILIDEDFAEPSSGIDTAFEQFASEAEESMSTVATESVDMGKPLMDFETVDEENSFEPVAQLDTAMESNSAMANGQSSDSSGAELVNEARLIGNRFVTEIEDQKQTEKPSGLWTKNPFVGSKDADYSFSTDEVASAQPKQASFAIDSSSVLELESNNTQASYPEPDLSQVNHVHNDIAPLNGTLPESVAQEAVHHIEYGKSLSRRGASFGARQKFFAALGVIARGNDVQTGGNAYTTALGRATRALREVQDFAVRNADIHVGGNVAEILETHQTRIISDSDAAVMNPMEAMQRYFTFAHQQLSFAGGNNVVTAEALYCLGKLHTVMAKHHPETLDVAKAIVFHRAAVSSDAGNSRSYNELGVLLARSGQLGEAESLFKKSLQIQPIAETWQNLAKTHGRQGEVELAQLAQTEFSIAAQSAPVLSPSAQIAWLPGQAFNQVGPADFHDSKSTISGAVVPASRTTALTDENDSSKKTFAERFNLKNWF